MRLNSVYDLNTPTEGSLLKKGEHDMTKHLICQEVCFCGVICGTLFSVLVVSPSELFRLYLLVWHFC